MYHLMILEVKISKKVLRIQGFLFLGYFLFACSNQQLKVDDTNYSTLSGEAQGSTFSIVFENTQQVDFTHAVDSLLKAVDLNFSTYVKESTISTFNNEHLALAVDSHFVKMLYQSMQLYATSNGAFNPLIKPLVNYWGFGENRKQPNEISEQKIDSLKNLLKPENILLVFDEDTIALNELYKKTDAIKPAVLYKKNKDVMLDFNAIAQGYTVDLLAELFESHSITNYMIEVGGEMITKGKNAKGEAWKIGIDKPIENAQERELEYIVSVDNKAIATSGNYRKFYEKDGIKYSHTLSPQSGFPVTHNLLSATVIANSCSMADGIATSLMVMGTEQAKLFLEEFPGIDVLLIYSDSTGNYTTWTSKNFPQNTK
jgi:thiamine biosynthesis lipoprotein